MLHILPHKCATRKASRRLGDEAVHGHASVQGTEATSGIPKRKEFESTLGTGNIFGMAVEIGIRNNNKGFA